MATGILTAGGGHEWETSVVTSLGRAGAPLSVVRRCADLPDLIGTASAGQAAACLVSADLRRLDRDAVGQLTGFGVTVVAVYRAADPDVVARLSRIGVTNTVADTAEPGEIIHALLDAVAADEPALDGATARATADPRWAWSTAGEVNAAADRSDSGEADVAAGSATAPPDRSATPSTATPSTAASAVSAPSDATGIARSASPLAPVGALPDAGVAAPGRHHVGDEPGVTLAGSDPGSAATVVAVWGPGGAPGRSTVAMGLADQAAATGRSVLLIDGDVYGGLLASAFGLLDESPGLAGACRLAANGRLDGDQLTSLCWKVGEQFALLTGIARADRWPEVRPSAVPVVIDIARTLVDLVVVDCAGPLESDEEITFDTMAPRRNGATLALLDHADVTLAVGSADPPGIERLVRGLPELAASVDGVTPRIVLNRVRKSAAPGREAAEAVHRFTGLEPIALLPEDRVACDAAWRLGTPLRSAAPKSPLTAALKGLATTVCV